MLFAITLAYTISVSVLSCDFDSKSPTAFSVDPWLYVRVCGEQRALLLIVSWREWQKELRECTFWHVYVRCCTWHSVLVICASRVVHITVSNNYHNFWLRRSFLNLTAKNYANWSTFARFIAKIKVAYFFLKHEVGYHLCIRNSISNTCIWNTAQYCLNYIDIIV